MEIDPSTERFEMPIQIKPADIDQLGHVSNVVYVRWIGEVATAHWKSAATAKQQGDLMWVVVRHEIDYKLAAKLEDAVIARTWVGKANALTFEHFTEILRASDRKMLAKAKTTWCPIDTRTGKPARVGDDVRKRFSISDPETPSN